MSFEEYQLRIRKLCGEAAPPLLQHFCADVVGRMLKYVKETDMQSLFERERELIGQLIRQAETRAPEGREVRAIL